MEKVVLGSLDAIKVIVKSHTAFAFVWPDEGDIKHGEFIPNTAPELVSPVLVDATTANLIYQVHEMMDPAVQPMFAKKIAESRETFLKVIEMCWKAAE